ncbi:MAG: Alcohol dehydrogenase, zinc-binding protein [Herminiimonas sp.]|nr:Alcohol dehydrogenase, zinc-binding protein [Herminiimonas sp.]
MQSYWMQTTESGAALELRDVAIPEPGPGQLLVRVRAAGLNRGEFLAGGIHKPGAAKAIGMEAAGEVAGLGAGVNGFAAGDRIMGRMTGAFSEYALLDAREAMAVPACLSWEEAASVPLTFLVMYDMLVSQGRLRPGEWVLITGASSGVGVASLQTAKALGAKVIGTSGSADKLERLQSLGLDVGICTRSGDFYDRVMQATEGHGADLVVNTVGGTVFADCIRTMAFQARLATVGYVDGVTTSEIDLAALHAKRLTLFGVSNKLRNAEQRVEGVPGFIADVLPLIGAGKIRPVVDRIFSFDQLEAAKAHMEANRHLGKIVLAGVPSKQ